MSHCINGYGISCFYQIQPSMKLSFNTIQPVETRTNYI